MAVEIRAFVQIHITGKANAIANVQIDAFIKILKDLLCAYGKFKRNMQSYETQAIWIKYPKQSTYYNMQRIIKWIILSFIQILTSINIDLLYLLFLNCSHALINFIPILIPMTLIEQIKI